MWKQWWPRRPCKYTGTPANTISLTIYTGQRIQYRSAKLLWSIVSTCLGTSGRFCRQLISEHGVYLDAPSANSDFFNVDKVATAFVICLSRRTVICSRRTTIELAWNQSYYHLPYFPYASFESCHLVNEGYEINWSSKRRSLAAIFYYGTTNRSDSWICSSIFGV